MEYKKCSAYPQCMAHQCDCLEIAIILEASKDIDVNTNKISEKPNSFNKTKKKK